MTDWLNNPTGSIGPAFNPDPVVARPVPKSGVKRSTIPKPANGGRIAVEDMLRFERVEGPAGVDALTSFRGHGSNAKIQLKMPEHVADWVRSNCEGNQNMAVVGLLVWAMNELEKRGERLVVRANPRATA